MKTKWRSDVRSPVRKRNFALPVCSTGSRTSFQNSGATLLTFSPTNVGSAHKQSISPPDMKHASLQTHNCNFKHLFVIQHTNNSE